MAKKLRIGLSLFFNNETNSGIVNYIYNILAALNTLPESKKPGVVLLHNNTAPVNYIRSLGYPHLKLLQFKEGPSKRYLKFLNNALIKFTGKNYFKHIKYYRKFDVLYPYFEMIDQRIKDFPNKVHWLVDFNNLAFPQHYADNGKFMEKYQQELVSKNEKVILSSFTLKNELEIYYPNYRNKISVVPFASYISMESTNENEVLKKYNVSKNKFFMSPNQFWEHKNQVVVIEAIIMLRELLLEKNFKILLTGSKEVNRGKGKYAEVLMEKIKEHKIEELVIFCGVLERNEQLILMQNSLALIQPSLYEGWSTLVEEAKALSKFIILSDLPVHREQINANVSFFDPKNSKQLTSIMEREIASPTKICQINYSENIKEFASRILDALS